MDIRYPRHGRCPEPGADALSQLLSDTFRRLDLGEITSVAIPIMKWLRPWS